MNGFSVLRSRLTGNLTTPDDTAGVDAFHSTIQHRPDAVVRAAAEADVVDTVRFAHAGGMPLQLHATGRRTAAPVGTPWAPPGWLARSASPLGPLEVLAAVGLILPAALDIAPVLAPLAAVGLVLLMVGAFIAHVRRREAQAIVVTLVLLALAAFVAWGRFGPQSFTG